MLIICMLNPSNLNVKYSKTKTSESVEKSEISQPNFLNSNNNSVLKYHLNCNSMLFWTLNVAYKTLNSAGGFAFHNGFSQNFADLDATTQKKRSFTSEKW